MGVTSAMLDNLNIVTFLQKPYSGNPWQYCRRCFICGYKLLVLLSVSGERIGRVIKGGLTMYKSDIEIAQSVPMKPIQEIAASLGLDDESYELYGKYKCKVDYNLLESMNDREDGKLVLVTAINPTPAGEGKTTTTVGLGDALKRLGKRVVIALREPSLGPVFGVKGGAAGGGYAQVVPMEDINLHFTGDLHAIGAANNLLAAMLDNHIYQATAEYRCKKDYLETLHGYE